MESLFDTVSELDLIRVVCIRKIEFGITCIRQAQTNGYYRVYLELGEKLNALKPIPQ
jgi:hypothetical protein